MTVAILTDRLAVEEQQEAMIEERRGVLYDRNVGHWAVMRSAPYCIFGYRDAYIHNRHPVFTHTAVWVSRRHTLKQALWVVCSNLGNKKGGVEMQPGGATHCSFACIAITHYFRSQDDYLADYLDLRQETSSEGSA